MYAICLGLPRNESICIDKKDKPYLKQVTMIL